MDEWLKYKVPAGWKQFRDVLLPELQQASYSHNSSITLPHPIKDVFELRTQNLELRT
jgi:hypothetical protein